MRSVCLFLVVALLASCAFADLSRHGESSQMHDLLAAMEKRVRAGLSEAEAGVSTRTSSRASQLANFQKDAASAKAASAKANAALDAKKVSNKASASSDAELVSEAKENAKRELALIAQIRILLGEKANGKCPVSVNSFPSQSKWSFVVANGGYSVSNGVLGNSKYTHNFMVAGLKEGTEWSDYTVNCDMRNVRNSGGKANWGHPGIVVNFKDASNYEVFYFRPHSSGGGSAIQYYVRKNGKNSYPARFTAKIPGGTFFHVKVVNTGTKLKLYLHNQANPVATVNSVFRKGSVGFVNHGSRGQMKNLRVCFNH